MTIRSTATLPTQPDHGPYRLRTVERNHATNAYAGDSRSAHDYADAHAVHRHGRAYVDASVLGSIATQAYRRGLRAWRQRQTPPPVRRAQESALGAPTPTLRPATTLPYVRVPSSTQSGRRRGAGVVAPAP